MPSPFPGMDPYIESCGLWEDFHGKLISSIENALASAAPDRYVVRLGERAYVELMTPDEAGIVKRNILQGDVSIALHSSAERRQRDFIDVGRSGLAVANETELMLANTPIEMRAFIETEFRESFVEIYELRPERRLVTTIEVLSPSNKTRYSGGWNRYLRKRQAHFEGDVNLVEIDLLRGGARMTMSNEWPNSPYYLLVHRRHEGVVCKVWPVTYSLPLPTVSVPLLPPDDDIPLRLQPMIEAIYQRSRYEYDIDYAKPCLPMLPPTDQQWLADKLGMT